MRMTLSKHAKIERENRLTYIAMTVGFGQVIRERITDTRRICLTSTGVILVKDVEEEFLITAYVGNKEQVRWIYCDERVPCEIWQLVKHNVVHVTQQNLIIFQKNLLTNQIKYVIIQTQKEKRR